MKKNKQLIHFLFEISTLTRLKRTGWQILGNGKETIAEHSYMVAMISYTLAMQENADIQKVLIMALFHDAEEARTGDTYRLAKKYVTNDKEKARNDLLSEIPNREEIKKILEEYEQRETTEAYIVKDADNLALCIMLKPMVEAGDTHAKEWLDANLSSMLLPSSKKLAQDLKSTDSQSWWKKERYILHEKR